MTMAVSQKHIDIIKEILLKYLPKGSQVWAFGSRVRGNAKKYSDLDLAIDYNGNELPLSVMAQISYDFEESDLPFKIDIVDWNTMSSQFKQNIQKELQKI
jgi:predicted nucleotidyltransferase